MTLNVKTTSWCLCACVRESSPCCHAEAFRVSPNWSAGDKWWMGQTWCPPHMLNTNTIQTHTHRAPPLLVSLLLSYKSPNTPVAWESERINHRKQPSSLHWDTDSTQRHERDSEEERGDSLHSFPFVCTTAVREMKVSLDIPSLPFMWHSKEALSSLGLLRCHHL